MKDIYILGDFLCTKDVSDKIYTENYVQLFGEKLYNVIFSQNNQIIVNLEGPITCTKNIQKKGGSPNVKSNPIIVDFLKKIPNCLVLGANNHITDYGRDGLADTIRILKENNIPFIGSSIGVEDTLIPYYMSIENKRIGICAFAQNEFSTKASIKSDYGASSYNPLKTFDEIKNIKNSCDYLIVLFHGGKENYQYPSPNQMEICHRLVEFGANLVVCQHSHVVGCMEKYHSGEIVYGTGNFLMNISNHPLWRTSVAIKISFDRKEKATVTYIPFLKKNDTNICIAEGEKNKEILDGFYSRSKEILGYSFVENKWREYCMSECYNILPSLFHYSRAVYWIDKLTNRTVTKHKLKNWRANLIMLNYYRCEIINEMIQTILYEIEE